MIIRVIVPPTTHYLHDGYEIHYLAASGKLLFKNVTADRDNLPSQAIIDASDTEFKRRNPKLSNYKILGYDVTCKSINEQEKPGSGPVGFNDVVEAVERLEESKKIEIEVREIDMIMQYRGIVRHYRAKLDRYLYWKGYYDIDDVPNSGFTLKEVQDKIDALAIEAFKRKCPNHEFKIK